MSDYAMDKPVEVFYSYSHKDEKLREKLETHLSMLKNEGVIESWYDRKIGVGTEWKGQIDEHLNSASIILLLISSNFLASSYCYDIELNRAMERHQTGEARVIPIILRASDWHTAPFGILQALPKDGKAVTSWSNRDEAFTDIAKGIRIAVKEINVENQKSSSSSNTVLNIVKTPDAFLDLARGSQLLSQFNNAYREQDWDEVIKLSRSLIEQNPNDPKIRQKSAKAYREKGIYYRIKKEYHRSIETLNQAIQLEPDNPDLYWTRGKTYRESKQFDEVITDWSFAIDSGLNYAENYRWRGNIYNEELHEIELARKDYQRASELGDKEAQKKLTTLPTYPGLASLPSSPLPISTVSTEGGMYNEQGNISNSGGINIFGSNQGEIHFHHYGSHNNKKQDTRQDNYKPLDEGLKPNCYITTHKRESYRIVFEKVSALMESLGFQDNKPVYKITIERSTHELPKQGDIVEVLEIPEFPELKGEWLLKSAPFTNTKTGYIEFIVVKAIILEIL